MSTLTLDERALDRLGARLADGPFSALAEAILDAARAVVRAEAYDTGELHDSLAVVLYVDGRHVAGPAIEPPSLIRRGIEAFVVATADHARFVHDGTIDTEAVPFLRLAAGRVTPRAAAIARAAT